MSLRAWRVCSALVIAGCGTAAPPSSAPSAPPPSAAPPIAAPPSAAPPIAPPPSSPAPTTPCEIARAESEAPLPAIREAIEACSSPASLRRALHGLLRDLGECNATHDAVWSLVVESGSVTCNERLELTVRLVFVDAAGVHRAPEALSLDEELGLGGHRAHVLRLADYDGDGVAEVFVVREDFDFEDPSRPTTRLFSFRDGAIGPYAPAEGIDLADVVDLDGDDRPDLVSIGRYWHGTECGEDPPLTGLPPVLFHSLPDGTFSPSDEVAAHWLRERCPAAPEALLAREWPCGETETIAHIACARLWGASADDVTDTLTAERDTLDAETAEALAGSWSMLLDAARIEPPLVLTPLPEVDAGPPPSPEPSELAEPADPAAPDQGGEAPFQ